MQIVAASVLSIVLFFVLLFGYIKLAGPIPFAINSVTTNKTDTFNVTGEGKVSVKPDLALVSVGVQTQGASVKATQDQLNSSINAVSATIKALGIDQKDIQTENYNIYPSRDFQSANQKITGYSASTNLSIKVRDLDKVNDVIDAATKAGANQVGGIGFDVDDKSKAEDEARSKAVAEAKKKAQQAAKIAGFSLGRIINYSEDFGGGPRVFNTASLQVAGAAPKSTQVEVGSNEVVVNVTLSYEIR